jgi:hypothetical protein
LITGTNSNCGARGSGVGPGEDGEDEDEDDSGEAQSESISHLTEEEQMQQLMGFGGCSTTKNTEVEDNSVTAARGATGITKRREYRQYMNRKIVRKDGGDFGGGKGGKGGGKGKGGKGKGGKGY